MFFILVYHKFVGVSRECCLFTDLTYTSQVCYRHKENKVDQKAQKGQQSATYTVLSLAINDSYDDTTDIQDRSDRYDDYSDYRNKQFGWIIYTADKNDQD